VRALSLGIAADQVIVSTSATQWPEGSTDMLNYGCLLLSRNTQKNPQRLHQLKAVKESKHLENLVSSWLKASGGTGGVDYSNLLLHNVNGA
jgi:hypothetical protein